MVKLHFPDDPTAWGFKNRPTKSQALGFLFGSLGGRLADSSGCLGASWCCLAASWPKGPRLWGFQSGTESTPRVPRESLGASKLARNQPNKGPCSNLAQNPYQKGPWNPMGDMGPQTPVPPPRFRLPLLPPKLWEGPNGIL